MHRILHAATILATTLFSSGGHAAQDAAAGAFELAGEALISSDYVFRGVSQSQRSAVLQLDIEAEHRSGAYAGIFASNVDYSEPGAPSDGIDREYSFRAGWRMDLDETTTLDLSAERMFYPGAAADASVDYTEFAAAIGRGDLLTFRIAHARDYYRLGASTTDIGIDLAWSFEAADVFVSAGHVEQETLTGTGYRYLDITLSRTVGRVRLDGGWSRAFGYSDAVASVNGNPRLARGALRLAAALGF